ncbi:DUF4253 domain-containing protein [Gorillibacterium sp. sgz500922]|uniref:DUF4253 domain-containing protein n=1 Tax=Gorillibacterium sp. sgz500922 TaxID=3446694 RepID=UPI003F664C88
MWLLLGVALALVYILITNQTRKKKSRKKKKTPPAPQGKQPIVPVRWTPNLSAESDQESEMARLSASKELYVPEAGAEPEPKGPAADEAADPVEPAFEPEAQAAESPVTEPVAAASSEAGIDSGRAEEFEEELDAPSPLPVYVNPEEVLGQDRIHSLWEAGRALEKLAGTPPRPYMTFDFGRRKFPQAQSVLADEESARGWVDALQERLDGELVAFIGTTRSQEEGVQGVEVVIARGETPFDILRLAQTDAANYDLSTEDIVTKLKELDRRYGLRIYAAQTDSVGFELKKQPSDVQAFAEELYAFCPDLVDQGVGSLEHLTDYLKDHRDLHLWWD